MRRVQNKVALITGGASGIGKATAKLLAREGAVVVFTDLSERDITSVSTEIGSSAIFCKHDVTNSQQWEDVIKLIGDRFHKLDILVNCAGIAGINAAQDPENATLDTWRQVMNVNMEGVFLGCQHAIPLMKATGGSIVNISSYAAIIGTPLAVAYGASKAGVRQFSKSVALYCAQQGYKIRCNCILPGAILTPMWEGFLGSGEERNQRSEQITKQIPLGVWGEPEDVAYAVLYFASDESKFITGAELVIDGGQSVG
ncbi:3-oxoacyl-(acyl-carrier-protein) reductase [Crinalium epipsammum PCC 9333]|uniref:3-oxoacyl-(Acyl-carrier-protein) reductase n=1 Tax=Crinalium epipsammum PCC 9333 TaxID=1173022 RepID=K9W1R0_9CYAN|nr:glucose 1-dehydrogenase [Crinalium epipsammum]AFZ13365.1 3-oxoacyl-(acyl-carrier-protein) reductase [Crinalium epipsammum PCC 9333]